MKWLHKIPILMNLFQELEMSRERMRRFFVVRSK